MSAPPALPGADLDWPSYAGKRHQHPWFILSQLLLAGAGYRVFVHGSDGHTPGRLYTGEAMRQLGLPVARNWEEAGAQLENSNLCHLPLRRFCGPLHELMQLRALLGLRSPVNTLVRMFNPLRAPCSIQSIFHPAYGARHQEADLLLGQRRALVFKGESGEVEIKPQADTRLQLLREGEREELLLPRCTDRRVTAVDTPRVEPLRELWRGTRVDPYGSAAVLATTAAALVLLRPGLAVPAAHRQAAALWRERELGRLG
jgi:anthranilate phosphoribosyltransferase